MIFANMAPWQLLVWIMGLELLSVPIIVYVANAISIGFFKAKEQHQARMLNSLGNTFEKMGKDLDKMKEDIKHVDETNS